MALTAFAVIAVIAVVLHWMIATLVRTLVTALFDRDPTTYERIYGLIWVTRHPRPSNDERTGADGHAGDLRGDGDRPVRDGPVPVASLAHDGRSRP
ncbi:hypothetical protein BTZ20_2928 [Rhodococcus sp. MTM3W5.2]|uniref:hypothetical protein n=1 Tax=Rhodococcus sp. MTM3W5.2 TaxID=1805827 RepID=UPI000979509C|nr:hypothetical protein [Rhodococcus sp. MTM3W5.2]AQA24960.1 hypothetical protein BTZ20_2928 [Rhodococcus sp. MTM3W5.2]